MTSVFYGKFVAIRLFLIIPIAILLALLILSENALHRALFVVGIVVLEIARDVLSVYEARKVAGGIDKQK